MNAPSQQTTTQRARILSTILAIVGMLGVLLGFAAWAISSPISGSPDDDYHLGSIWCPRPIDESGCTFEVKDGVISSVEVPEVIPDSKKCIAFKPKKDASCSLDASDKELVPTDRFDDGGYPWGYYQLHHLLVGEDVHHSIVMMRLLNILIGLGGLFLVGALAAPHIRHALVIATLTAWVPMGVYFIASNNPSSWALSGCLIYGASLLASTEARGWRRWALLGTMTLGAVLAATSRTDSAFYLFVITLAMWFYIKITRNRLPTLVLSLALAVVGMVILSSTGQTASLTSDGGWPTYPKLETWRIFILNLEKLPEHIASWWGLTWGPGWFDVPLLGWSTLGMIFVVGGVVFVAADKLHPRKILAITVMTGALFGIPVVSLTLRQVQPVVFYQGRYMLPLLAVVLLVWLTRRDKKIFFRSPGQLILLIIVVSWANSMALRQVIRRYTLGLADNTLIGFGLPKWWPWAFSPAEAWMVGSLAMLGGLMLISFATIHSVKALQQVGEHVEQTEHSEQIKQAEQTHQEEPAEEVATHATPVAEGVTTSLTHADSTTTHPDA